MFSFSDIILNAHAQISTARMLPHVPFKFRFFTFINAFLHTMVDTTKVQRARMEKIGYETIFKFSEEIKGPLFFVTVILIFLVLTGT